MRIVLHIGQQKTGTSAVQTALSLNEHAIKQSKILYFRARFEKRRVFSHSYLGAVIDFPKPPSRLSERYVNVEGHTASSLDVLLDECCAEMAFVCEIEKPDVLVLSSEVLFRPISKQAAMKLKQKLLTVCDDISVVAYVRSPAGYYLGRLQQRLRTSGEIPPPGPVEYRETLEAYLDAFGSVQVVEYDRSNLFEGDVVLDFARRFVPELDRSLLTDRGELVNSGYSSEIMSILQDFSKIERFADINRQPELLELLEKNLLSTKLPSSATKAKLKPEVAQFVSDSSVDTRWIKDTFGINFRDVDYNSVGSPASIEVSASPMIAEVCVVDEKSKYALLVSFLGNVLWQRHAAVTSARRQKAKKEKQQKRAEAKAREQDGVSPVSI